MNLEILIIFLLYFISHSIFLGIVLHNFSNAPRINKSKTNFKKHNNISVLIPARNEEKNIGIVLHSLLQQNYSIDEILVLDDQSTDNTSEKVNAFAEKDSRIKLLKGKPLPEGWLGKNWACHQLSQNAKGELLLFIDADVELSDNAVENSVRTFYENKVKMLSVFPTQKIKSIGEWLVVPLMNWLLLTFLPFRKVLTSKNDKYSAANGQFILIEKIIYDKIGGHESVKSKVVEDIELMRSVKAEGERAITCLGDEAIKCRMYSSLPDAINGFSKNFYRGFNTSRPVFLLLISIFIILFFVPIILLFVNYIFFLIVLLIIFQRIFVSFVSKQNWVVNLILHPFQMLFMFYIGVRSSSKRKHKWKERLI